MASDILAIYDALAAVTVSDGTHDIAARNVEDQPAALNTGILPVRVLTVLDPFNSLDRARSETAWAAQEGSGFFFITWTIYDILYHTPLYQGRGVRDVNIPLLTYIANYYDMLSTNAPLLHNYNDASVERATLVPLVLRYPGQTDYAVYAVRCMLQIKERCP